MNEQEKKQEKVAQSPTWHKVEDAAFWLLLGLLLFGVGMLIIGLLFGAGYWTADSPAARGLLFAAGIGGSGYIFMVSYCALRRKAPKAGSQEQEKTKEAQ